MPIVQSFNLLASTCPSLKEPVNFTEVRELGVANCKSNTCRDSEMRHYRIREQDSRKNPHVIYSLYNKI